MRKVCHKYDTLAWIKVGGRDRNFREDIYSLCSSLSWNALRPGNKQTTSRQYSVNASVGSTEMLQTGKSDYGGLPPIYSDT